MIRDFIFPMKNTTVIFKLVSLKGDGFHLHLKMLVNGKSANMLIDTGASRSVFDKKRIEKFVGKNNYRSHTREATGLGTNSMQTFVTRLKRIKIGKLEIADYETGIVDMSHVNVSYKQLGVKPIDGVIGSDLLHKYKAAIDYPKKTIKLFSKK